MERASSCKNFSLRFSNKKFRLRYNRAHHQSIDFNLLSSELPSSISDTFRIHFHLRLHFVSSSISSRSHHSIPDPFKQFPFYVHLKSICQVTLSRYMVTLHCRVTLSRYFITLCCTFRIHFHLRLHLRFRFKFHPRFLITLLPCHVTLSRYLVTSPCHVTLSLYLVTLPSKYI